MEEEVENKELEPESPGSEKKYFTTWRNKWITSDAGSIDDFINTYEGLAEMMRRWKAEGIILDPDIIGGVDDDYAQFCTYDEAVALKEGFIEEEPPEEYEEYDESLEDEIFRPLFLEFQINEYLSLKLHDKFIQIYVNEKPFKHCRYLLIVDPLKNKQQHEIDSIDEAELLYSNNLEKEIRPEDLGITKEQEFWAHCSNLQAWAENNYDSRLLHRNLAFPLLKELAEGGDTKARKVFKDEIGVRFVSGYLPVMRYLFREKYLDYLTPEEFSTLLDELDYSTLSLDSLLYEVDDYIISKHGRCFLKRIAKEFKDDMTIHYVKLKTFLLDKSEESPLAFTKDNSFFIRGSGIILV